MYIHSLLCLTGSADAPRALGPRAGAGSLLRQNQIYCQRVCTNVLRNRFRGLRFFWGAAVSLRKTLSKTHQYLPSKGTPILSATTPLTAATVESARARRMRLGKLARKASLDHRLCIFRLVRLVCLGGQGVQPQPKCAGRAWAARVHNPTWETQQARNPDSA